MRRYRGETKVLRQWEWLSALASVVDRRLPHPLKIRGLGSLAPPRKDDGKPKSLLEQARIHKAVQQGGLSGLGPENDPQLTSRATEG